MYLRINDSYNYAIYKTLSLKAIYDERLFNLQLSIDKLKSAGQASK